jgi:DNA-binding response OmpR family regulator
MSKRVLICEDDSAIRLLLDKLLTRHGLEVDSVGTGAEAMSRVRDETYDLILLDLLTPGMSGYDVIDRLRRERPHLLDRVVIVTALQRAFVEPLPVAAVMRKPFELAEFDLVIERVLCRAANPRSFDERRAAGAVK